MDLDIQYDMLARQEDTGRYFGLILTGGPGIGKTYAAMGMKRPGDPFLRFAVPGRSKEDMVTYPVPELVKQGVDGQRSKWTINQVITEPGFEQLLEENCGDKPGLLLIDDVTGADQSVQNAMLELVQFGRVGEHQLGPNIVIAMTGNNTTDGAYAIEWSNALMGRSHFVQYKANFERWMELPVNKNLDPIVAGFLRANPDFFAPDRANQEMDNKCFDENGAGGCPRLWTTLGTSTMKKWGGLKQFKGNILFPTQTDYVNSLVGTKTGGAFETFAKIMYDYPSAQELFENPDKWTELPLAKRNDKACVYATAQSVRQYCLALNEKINESSGNKYGKKEIAEKEALVMKFCNVVARLMQQDHEMGAFCIRYLALKLAHDPKETLVGQLAGYGWGLPGVDPVLVAANFPSVMKNIKEVSDLMDKGNAPSR